MADRVRRLGVRYERRADLLQGLLHLAGALLCVRFLVPHRVTSVALAAGAAASPGGAAVGDISRPAPSA